MDQLERADFSQSRDSTGIHRLDEVIGGGFPRPSTTAIVGAPGSGTTSFCTQFAVSSLLEGRKVLIVCTDEPVEHFLRYFKSRGPLDVDSYLEEKKLVVVDMYGKFIEHIGIRDYGDVNLVREFPLNKFILETRRAVQTEEGEEPSGLTTILDSVTALSPFLGVRDIYRGVREVQDLIRAHNNIVLMTVHEGVLEGNFVQAVRQQADNVIRMKMRWVRSNLKREMIIEKVGFTEIKQPVLGFVITERGIEII
ncbi:MAG: RAD55 family ATPase [Candidatus Atabeyarchaeum deiterrae]